MEQEIQENKDINDSIEIIELNDEFDHSPIETQSTVNNQKVLDSDDLSQESFENMLYEINGEHGSINSNSKNKVNIPSLGIIDDFEKEETVPTEIYNFNKKLHDDELKDETPTIHEMQDDSEFEDISLNNFEPDEIKFDETDEVDNSGKVESQYYDNDFEKVKVIIDNCKKDLNNLGYNVEYEKFDFETMYQIIFKISKN